MTPEEELLAQKPIKVDGRGRDGLYVNASADLSANNGSRGKLNNDQLEERAALHAQRVHTGSPSVASIRQHWLQAYGISISENSEHEWARNNTKRIDQKVSLLIEKGLMPVIAVSDATITTHLQAGARDILDTMKYNKKVGKSLCAELEEYTDWYHMIGAISREKYYEASDEQRVIFDKRLQTQLDLRRSHINAYSAISKATQEQGKVLIDMMKAVSEINKGGTAYKNALDKKVSDSMKELGLQAAKKKELEEEDPLAPVSDDDRIN